MRAKLLSLALGLGLTASSLSPGTAFAQTSQFGRSPCPGSTLKNPADPNNFTVNGTVLRIVSAPTLQQARNLVGGQLATPARELVGGQVGANEDREKSATGRACYATFLTADLTGQVQVIFLDLSWLSDEEFFDFVNLEQNESVQIGLIELVDGSFRAGEYWELAKGSKVNNTDWGILEVWTTRDDRSTPGSAMSWTIA